MSAHDRMVDDLGAKLALDICNAVNQTLSLIEAGEDQIQVLHDIAISFTAVIAAKMSDAHGGDPTAEEVMEILFERMKKLHREETETA